MIFEKKKEKKINTIQVQTKTLHDNSGDKKENFKELHTILIIREPKLIAISQQQPYPYYSHFTQCAHLYNNVISLQQ